MKENKCPGNKKNHFIFSVFLLNCCQNDVILPCACTVSIGRTKSWVRQMLEHRHSDRDCSSSIGPVTYCPGCCQDGYCLTIWLRTAQSIDLMKLKNHKNHHTDLYQDNICVLRRSQTFQMWITLSRPFNRHTDKLHLHLKTGPIPEVGKRTHVIVPLVEELKGNCWEAAVVKENDKRIKLSVNSPGTAVIGRYRLTVETTCPNGLAIYTCNPSDDIYMLFNPWSKDDSVFLDDEEERQEYVLNDVGRIYNGRVNQIGARTWNYGQFDSGILATCLYILEKSKTLCSGWGDPVNVVRIVSAMVNSNDDAGVLVGKWSGDYTGGTCPTFWNGSVEILQQYYASKGSPVKYGQCWVFGGVTTTVLRCLGIPTRTVTNFNSAHDTDVSLTIDVYVDENMDTITNKNQDSIWNFHVWNDCWMARPDLPPGNGGWQAVDATPQETSNGIYCCGPAPLTAIRNGQVYLKYDCPFVFAEVNSDRILWQRNADGTYSKIFTEKKVVGCNISTKAVGSDERNDITHMYKYAEGSEEERVAVETACSYGSKPDTYESPTAKDVTMKVVMEGEGPKLGSDAELIVKFINHSCENRNVSLNILKILALTYDKYKDLLVDQGALMLTLLGRVKETQQVLATQFGFLLRTPDLIIKPIGKPVVGQKMTVEISFINPLPEELKDVVLNVEGIGLLPVQKITYGDIRSNGRVTITKDFTPTLAGAKKFVASLHCSQLTQVHGVADIYVEA
uniref:Protein-glutamine gamma-glutamyltransferase K n=1 Tax=Oryzias latipes TaxID=8090 RepID=A0A3B3ILZ2_ORYLA